MKKYLKKKILSKIKIKLNLNKLFTIKGERFEICYENCAKFL